MPFFGGHRMEQHMGTALLSPCETCRIKKPVVQVSLLALLSEECKSL